MSLAIDKIGHYIIYQDFVGISLDWILVNGIVDENYRLEIDVQFLDLYSQEQKRKMQL
jgi:hypothetical protein